MSISVLWNRVTASYIEENIPQAAHEVRFEHRQVDDSAAGNACPALYPVSRPTAPQSYRVRPRQSLSSLIMLSRPPQPSLQRPLVWSTALRQ